MEFILINSDEDLAKWEAFMKENQLSSKRVETGIVYSIKGDSNVEEYAQATVEIMATYDAGSQAFDVFVENEIGEKAVKRYEGYREFDDY